MSANPVPKASDVIQFIFEMGQLREEARHGWLRIYENPESVAEHTQRAAMLGYFIAQCEGFSDPNLVATMILFHDMHETRTGDGDKVQRKYVQLDEEKAAAEQMAPLAGAGKAILAMWNEVETQSTEAGRLAKDAEVLEMAFTAREMIVRGNTEAQHWINSIKPRIKTPSALAILELVNSADPAQWWKEVCR